MKTSQINMLRILVLWSPWNKQKVIKKQVKKSSNSQNTKNSINRMWNL